MVILCDASDDSFFFRLFTVRDTTAIDKKRIKQSNVQIKGSDISGDTFYLVWFCG